MIVVAAHGVVSGVFSGRVIPQCQDGYTDRAVSSNRDRGYHVASPVWLHIILEVALATAAATVEAVSTEAAAAAAAANSSKQAVLAGLQAAHNIQLTCRGQYIGEQSDNKSSM